ncbi:phage portal protein [Aestuariibius sp. 2305UL40-4]|uniref:phage portal protein n=1 Tax=Aestuariibius violaceus TaxID=3234132 RepID=UPI00345E5B0B
MIRLLKAALRGVRMELAAGESGWIALTGDGMLSTSGRTSNAGPRVSAESVMQLSAAWACVQTTAQLIGALPAAMYRKENDGTRVQIDDNLSAILRRRPNTDQTGLEFWEGMSAHMLLRGNACAERLMVGRRLVGLRPLINAMPKRRSDGRFDYPFYDRGKREVLPPEKVFHLRGFGAGDGLGLSAIKYGTQSFGSALAADETASTVFGGGMMAAGVLEAAQTLAPEQRQQLEGYLNQFVGSKRAGKIMTLEAGLKYQQLQMNPEDAQLLETRRFHIEDICRWFGVPPIIIGHAAEGQTMWGTGVEAIMLAWLTTGINPLLRRIEARIWRDLIPAARKNTDYYEVNREAMLQMDSIAKGGFLSNMTTSGIMSKDEARDKLNLPRRGGAADELFAQTALAPLEELMRGER